MAAYITNEEIADIFFNVAELLEIDEANHYRINAYTNAAVTIVNASESLARKVERGEDLTVLPTIGRDIALKIEEIVKTGELSMLEELEQTLPPQTVELSHVPGVGAKRVRLIEDQYGPVSDEVLRRAARRGELARLPGIGPKIQNAIKRHFSTRK